MLRVPECEFCQELSAPRSCRFARIYGGTAGGRIVAREHGFVVMPTLGQLFEGSMLVLPEHHHETVAELPPWMLEALLPLLERLERQLRPLGTPILLEHGARCTTGGGCGIYHAHLHLVPLPGPMLWSDILTRQAASARSLADAYARLRGSSQYLLCRDTAGEVRMVDELESHPELARSQYFRRALARHFALDAPWDWRAYSHQEGRLLATLARFGDAHVSVG